MVLNNFSKGNQYLQNPIKNEHVIFYKGFVVFLTKHTIIHNLKVCILVDRPR